MTTAQPPVDVADLAIRARGQLDVAESPRELYNIALRWAKGDPALAKKLLRAYSPERTA